MWILYAFGAAFFAGITAILAKIGIKNTDSNLATAIRTVVILVFSWLMVFIVGSAGTIISLSVKTVVFLVLSGIATGLSWLCYYHALQIGQVQKVVPIDKMSVVFTLILAYVVFHESMSIKEIIGGMLIAAGTLVMVL